MNNKFKHNTKIKHIRNTDVCFGVLESKYNDSDKSYNVVGFWYNITNPNKHFIIEKDHIIITENEIDNWVQIQ